MKTFLNKDKIMVKGQIEIKTLNCKKKVVNKSKLKISNKVLLTKDIIQAFGINN